MSENDIRVTVTITRKINLGYYESTDLFFGVTNVPVDATNEEIEEALTTGDRAFHFLREHVRQRTQEAMQERRSGRQPTT